MSFLKDVLFALRLLRKNPAFTLVAVLTLGLAVAANSVVFSVVNAVLVKPLPYPAPERLVRIDTQFPSMGFSQFWLSPPEYLALARDAKSYEAVGAWVNNSTNLTGGDHPVAVAAAYASASMLPTVGVQPLLGRFFDQSEDVPGPVRVVVIGYGLWQETFAGDPSIVGRTVQIDARPVRIVGVMPKGFDYPAAGTQMWIPVEIDRATMSASNHYLTVVGRLRPGVSVEAARAEIASLTTGWQAADPKGHTVGPRHPMILSGLGDDMVASVKVALLTLQGAVVFVLLIACANISNLLLARAEGRSGEIAIRAAVGASRGRMVRQFLTESVVLGLLGALLGLLLSAWGLDAAVAFLPEGVPRAAEIALDPSVLAFALGVSLAASLLFGLAPILHTRGSLGTTLRSGPQRTTAGGKSQFLRRALVIVEVGLAIVLVTGAGLMVKSFVRLQQVDLGFEPRGLLTLDVELPSKTYETQDQAQAFWKKLVDGAAGLSGAKSATAVYGLPPTRQIMANDFAIVGRTYAKGEPDWNVNFWQMVTDGFLDTLGAHLVRGRTILPSDDDKAPSVMLVNEAFARKYFAGEDVLGKQIVVSPNDDMSGKPTTIVGVLADMKQQGVDAAAGTEFFIPIRQIAIAHGLIPRSGKLIVRAQGDPRALFASVRALLGSVDPNLPVAKLRTMNQVVYEAIGKPAFVAALLATFATIALLMAAIGVYGVMTYTVERRTSELGIRMALGADPGRLEAMLVKQGLALACAGVSFGLVAAWAVNVALRQWLARLLFEVGTVDPATYGAVVVLTIGVAALASYVPAHRATKIHAMRAIRHE